MRIVGFGQEETRQEPERQARPVADQVPVRSLVSVRFKRSNRTLTYFNDRFDLKVGDRVLVSGKLEGEVGIVESVTRKFRIRLSDYQKVIALAQTPIRGTYTPKGNMMLSYGEDALSAEDFRRWILPPIGEPDVPEEVLFGDGYEIPLEDPLEAEDADPAVFERALEYCREGRIGYVALRGSAGKAFVRGSRWYEVDFCVRGDMLQEGYCECPYPGLCKHLLALAALLSVMARHGDVDLGRDLTLIAADRFFDMVRHSGQDVTV